MARSPESAQNIALPPDRTTTSLSLGLQGDFTISQTACTIQKGGGEVRLRVTIVLVDSMNQKLSFKSGNITLQQVGLSNGTLYYPTKNASSISGPESGSQWIGQTSFPIAGGSFDNGQVIDAVLLVRVVIEDQTQPLIEGVPITVSSPWTSYTECP